MLPQQKKLASSFRRFVCDLCLLKLRLYRSRQIWDYRAFSSRYILPARGTGGRMPPRLDREVNFYDQTPDGQRIERFVDENYEKQAQKEFFEEDLKNTVEENVPTLRKILDSSAPTDYQFSQGLASFEKIGENFKALADKLKSAGDLEKLSPEELKKLQDILDNEFLGMICI